MDIRPDFTREKERVWFPIVKSLGFLNPRLTPQEEDRKTACDIVAGGKRFGVRIRNSRKYNEKAIQQYLTEFTIRYKRPSGASTEYEKIFKKPVNPLDYIGYGWTSTGYFVDHWLFIDVKVLITVRRSGYLKPFYKDIKQNSEKEGSYFLPVSIHALHEMLPRRVFNDLFPYRSPGHPGFKFNRDIS